MLIKEIMVEALETGQRVAIPGNIKMPLSKRAKELMNDDYFAEEDLKYFSLIEDVCSDFIKVMKSSGRFLYRGMKNKSTTQAPVIYGKSFENRIPKDTDLDIQEKVDKLLRIGGFKALRSNSIFTSSDSQWIERFGYPYIIFPRNGFHYTWSIHGDWIPDENDFPEGFIENVTYYSVLRFFEDLSYWLKSDIDYVIVGDKNQDAYFENIFDVPAKRKEIQLQNNQLKKDLGIVKKAFNAAKKKDNKKDHIETSHEHLKLIKPFIDKLEAFEKAIPGLSYYKRLDLYKGVYSKIKNPVHESSKESLQKFSEQFIKKHKLLNDTNLASALKSKKEIYISGEYIAFFADDYDELLSKYFKI